MDPDLTVSHLVTVRRLELGRPLVRPPDIVVAGLIFYQGFFFLSSFFFFRPLITELAEGNSTKIGHMVGSKYNFKIHVQNLGCPLPLQIGGPKPIFWRFRNLTATLTAYIYGYIYMI